MAASVGLPVTWFRVGKAHAVIIDGEILHQSTEFEVRYHSRFFVQAAHEMIYESSENNNFFTIRSLSHLPRLSATTSKIAKFLFSKSFFNIEENYY